MFGPVMQFLPELEAFDIIERGMDFSKAYSGTRQVEFLGHVTRGLSFGNAAPKRPEDSLRLHLCGMVRDAGGIQAA